MNLVQRVQDILLKPKETWPVIAAEPGDAKSLFMGYVAVLASIPPLASFVSMALGGLGMYTRVPLLSSLVAAVVPMPCRWAWCCCWGSGWTNLPPVLAAHATRSTRSRWWLMQ